MQCVRTVQKWRAKPNKKSEKKVQHNKKIENDLISNWWHSIHLTICCLPHSFQRFIPELAHRPTAAAAKKWDFNGKLCIYMCEFRIKFAFEVVFHNNNIKTTFFPVISVYSVGFCVSHTFCVHSYELSLLHVLLCVRVCHTFVEVNNPKRLTDLIFSWVRT